MEFAYLSVKLRAPDGQQIKHLAAGFFESDPDRQKPVSSVEPDIDLTPDALSPAISRQMDRRDNYSARKHDVRFGDHREIDLLDLIPASHGQKNRLTDRESLGINLQHPGKLNHET